MSNHPMITIDLADQQSIDRLATGIDLAGGGHQEKFKEAADLLRNYKETTELSPQQIKHIFENLGISDVYTPAEMNEHLHNTDRAYVLRRKYFDSVISEIQFELILEEIVSGLTQSISGEILSAIISVIKNFSVICLSNKDIQSIYKEVCFKFFTQNGPDVLILIINIDYGANLRQTTCVEKIFKLMRSNIHVSFFGAVCRTELNKSIM